MKLLCLILLACSLSIAQQETSAPAKLDCSTGVKPTWDAAQHGAAQADCEFYNASLERGGDAWGDFAAANACLPRGKEKDEIRAAYKKTYAAPGFRLSWRPERAERFGSTYVVTSGPYELHTQQEGKDRTAHGTYLTVWQQQADGSWGFVWDGGEEAKEQK